MIKSVKVTSRRSVKLGRDDFFTFECTLEATTDDRPVDEVLEELWAKVNNEVDNQIEVSAQDLQ